MPEYDEEGNETFNSYFYDMIPKPTPSFQWQRRYEYARRKACVFAGPRGCTKTTSIAIDSIFELITCPKFSIAYCTVKEDLGISFTNSKMRPQVYENPRIQEDWAPAYGVPSLRPKRNQMSTGSEHFFLANHSNMKITSIASAQRGMRPRRYKMDDPERDNENRISLDRILADMEALLFRVIFPMIIEPGRFLSWDGTFVSPRHFLWQMMEVDEHLRAKDKRFDQFFRMIAPVELPNAPDGRVLSAWPEMWPGDEQERIEQGLPEGTPTLVYLRDELLGPATYRAEMLCDPQASVGGHFKPDEELHGYWYEQCDADLELCPYRSSSLICYRQGDEVRKRSISDLLAKCGAFVTGDTSYTNTVLSDFKTACVMVIDEDFNLFILDLWSEQCDLPHQILSTLRIAAKWRATSIHPEVIREGKRLEAGLRDIIANRATEIADIDWFPAIKGINPPANLSKQTRIDTALYLRFVRNAIKLPFYLKRKHPFDRLFSQLEAFNPQVADGNLKKDDEIDTIAMHLDALRVRPTHMKPNTPPETDADKLKRGVRLDEFGLPLIERAYNSLTPTDIAEIIKHNTYSAPTQESIL